MHRARGAVAWSNGCRVPIRFDTVRRCGQAGDGGGELECDHAGDLSMVPPG